MNAKPGPPGTQALGPVATTAAIILGFLLLVASWSLLHLDFFYLGEIPDTGLYEAYGERILRGDIPYRDFGVGYPPGALPVFVLPALASHDGYRAAFEFLMLLCGEAAIAFVALTLRAAGAGRVRLFAAVAFIGLAPLALGSVVLSRYDLWPAALTAAGLAALVSGRPLLGTGALAFGTVTKLYPVVIFPLALIYLVRRHGRRAALAPALAFAALCTALIVPFTLSGDRLERTADAQTLGRGLQMESLGSALLLAADKLGSYEPTVVDSVGSQGLAGSLPDVLAALSLALAALSVLVVWVAFGRGSASIDRLLLASVCAVVGFVAFGKVLSPQYLIWLVPLVPLVAGRVGMAANALLAGALVLTQLWFPSRYTELVFLGDVTWLVLVRDLILVGLYALLLAALWPAHGFRTEQP